jgi:alpha-beta hydrolase superfamily lysophospholipase
MGTSDWDLPGSDGLPIRGTTHAPEGDPRAVVLIVHGYLGYKEYGMFPWLASRLCGSGHIVHRINLSHSGMDHGAGPFDEAVFARDTWSRGIEDIALLLEAIDRGQLAGQDCGAVLLGHSRGGAGCLLATGRHGGEEAFARVVGIVSMSSPAALMQITEEDAERMLAEGSMPLASSRTGQTLRVGAAWLQEQRDDPEAHDLLAQVATLKVPVGLLHGADDPTVSAKDAVTIAQANPPRVRVHIVDGGDHVFNTPNPFDPHGDPSPQLAEAAAVIGEWIDRWVG